MIKRFFLSERNMMAAILVNAVLIFMLYFPGWRHNEWLELIDHVFILFFLLEAAVKLYTLKPRRYFADPWNRFDLIIVLGSLPSLLVQVIPVPDTSLLIILRLFRLIRLIRFIRFVPHLSKVITGLGRALQASLFVLLALFFLNLLLAIFTCHFFADIAPQYFGDPLIASYSIFQMFTVEGWNEIPATIAQSLTEQQAQAGIFNTSVLIGLTRLYFVLVVLLGGVFGMSLANAVFVDEMTMDNNDALERKVDDLHNEIRELKALLLRNEQKENP
ncbi:ion transporter [Phaeodactylibacter sp.]|jgi:voltage-gated sodium channel|uniref:ion transporter n=1 Tax=Phaeodactylibacter sp. TaxID=1940289 RepID=UPI0025FDC72F|nr:ion transporter [Phaeodactylibacter sp.]MCI4651741.1 ion transporter [Phaeodactylibacter sp.]MCI5091673.1 ion transporter [Phaeodactylibacter sp.]